MMQNTHFACFLYHHHGVHTLQMKIQNHFRISPVLFPKLLVSAQLPLGGLCSWHKADKACCHGQNVALHLT